MKYLLSEFVVPYLRQRYNLRTDIIKARVLRTAGIGESLLDAQIGNELLEQANPTVGLAAHSGQVDVRITAKADSEADADAMIAVVESELRERIGDFIYGIDDERIEQVLTVAFVRHGLKLAINETGIGEPISRAIRQSEEGNEILASTQLYSDPEALRASLDASPGASLRDLAEKAAEAVCKQGGASAGIAVVSYPDMNEQHADTEAGTAIAVYTPQQSRSRVYGFGGQSETAAEWANTWTLSMLWRMMKEQWGD
jgi:nicotinamide-nucleotide amidase